eukprot:CAMPEP_0184417368 /NCGR_PEP_ID=MMETSP0738-20130409/10152_1 /TAXON_ID=385413 /ORGANISM="Thalassiosira miniscula, Strain CCMP1093" /LENGTH=47 /DNA_ID= /DNA_START= /DNA_END= /DNA_ORIENTATION=
MPSSNVYTCTISPTPFAASSGVTGAVAAPVAAAGGASVPCASVVAGV